MDELEPSITIKDLDKIGIRVGRIVKVQNVEQSVKLVRLIVCFGDFE